MFLGLDADDLLSEEITITDACDQLIFGVTVKILCLMQGTYKGKIP
jgi:hypothetical protein